MVGVGGTGLGVAVGGTAVAVAVGGTCAGGGVLVAAGVAGFEHAVRANTAIENRPKSRFRTSPRRGLGISETPFRALRFL